MPLRLKISFVSLQEALETNGQTPRLPSNYIAPHAICTVSNASVWTVETCKALMIGLASEGNNVLK